MIMKSQIFLWIYTLIKVILFYEFGTLKMKKKKVEPNPTKI